VLTGYGSSLKYQDDEGAMPLIESFVKGRKYRQTEHAEGLILKNQPRLRGSVSPSQGDKKERKQTAVGEFSRRGTGVNLGS